MTKTTNETVILVTGATGTVGSEVIKQFTLPSLSSSMIIAPNLLAWLFAHIHHKLRTKYSTWKTMIVFYFTSCRQLSSRKNAGNNQRSKFRSWYCWCCCCLLFGKLPKKQGFVILLCTEYIADKSTAIEYYP